MKKRIQPFILILGIAQDGGIPHAGCRKKCCKNAWGKQSARLYATSIAIIDPIVKKRWLIDITPDIKDQLHILDTAFPIAQGLGIAGGFLTHGHIGHYTGLLQFEKAVMNTQNIPVHVMPRLEKMLRINDPWRVLVQANNIALKRLRANQIVILSDHIQMQPFIVLHRSEYTETIGFRISGPSKKVLFIPDIDSWKDCKINIEDEIKKVDLAFLDGTFFDKKELPHRDLSEIPHPLVVNSIERFSGMDIKEKNKIHFIHLNHTNPALISKSKERRQIKRNGFHIAKQFEKISI